VTAPHHDGLTKPKAFVVLRDEHKGRAGDAGRRAALAAELKDHVKQRLSKHKYPRWIVFVDELPKNDRGKIARKELRRRDVAGENPPGD
jgi:acyl-coenzyme A synthetase/AMP-(fatty) acid ligase